MLGSKAIDLCNPSDPICHAGQGNEWSGHTEGYVPVYTTQAAAFVASKLLAGTGQQVARVSAAAARAAARRHPATGPTDARVRPVDPRSRPRRPGPSTSPHTGPHGRPWSRRSASTDDISK